MQASSQWAFSYQRQWLLGARFLTARFLITEHEAGQKLASDVDIDRKTNSIVPLQNVLR